MCQCCIVVAWSVPRLHGLKMPVLGSGWLHGIFVSLCQCWVVVWVGLSQGLYVPMLGIGWVCPAVHVVVPISMSEQNQSSSVMLTNEAPAKDLQLEGKHLCLCHVLIFWSSLQASHK